MIGKLIWDDCPPTRMRRATTAEDIDNDIHVVNFKDEKYMLDTVLDLLNYNEKELSIDINATTEAKIETILAQLNTPRDYLLNILYASINGKQLFGPKPYNCLIGLDLENTPRSQIVKAIESELIRE